MGVIRQGILGGFANKVGSVVGTSWKGIAVMKALPLSVANPRTAPQVNNRTRFADAARWFAEINATIIKPLWDRFATQMSGYNAAVKYNVAFFNQTGLFQPQNVLISNGKMSATAIVATTADRSSNAIEVGWVNDSGQGLKLESDEAYLVVYNEDKGTFFQLANATAREEVAMGGVMPSDWEVDDVLHFYLAFRRSDGTVVSVSSYAEGVVVA